MTSRRLIRFMSAVFAAVFVVNVMAPGASVLKTSRADEVAETGVGSGDVEDGISEASSGFSDVQDKSKYYYKPVQWAAKNKVTYGYDDGTFKPENVVTRAQMVTFLWRLCGSPEPKTKTKPFSDIKKSDYWYKPAIWGNENGIVMGYKDGTFGPKKACTRAQAVTFMYRMSDKKDHLNSAKYTFSDLKGKEKEYYYKAAYWGMKAAIVVGLATDKASVKKFNPQGKVTRGQMVTFLYKLATYSTKTDGTGALKQNVMHTDGKVPTNYYDGTTVTPKATGKATATPTSEPGIKITTDYSYEIIPMVEPFNNYFFVKTDNPDPDTFCFVDKDTKYSDTEGTISPTDSRFADVVYKDKTTGRVNGGYICVGSGTDGGTVYLRTRSVTGKTAVTNITTGAVTYNKRYVSNDTDIAFNVEPVKDKADYLIDKYTVGRTDFFDKLDAAQAGLSEICLYSGAYVLGDLVKLTSAPYYGLSTSPHVDQNFYIQEPYSRKDNEPMLVSYLYPFILDSLGFPGLLGTVAKRLDPSATYKQSSSYHYYIDVTYGGKTRTYGGAGFGGGQGIYRDQILYTFKFNNASDDAYKNRDLTTLSQRLREYGNLTVDKDKGKDQTPLTWSSVRSAVGEGKYVRLLLITSIFGGSAIGYTYMYDDGSTGEGSQSWASVGYFSNVWFDGRYFNKYEYIYPGATLEDTVENVQPGLVFKDYKIKAPEDGKSYYVYGIVQKTSWGGQLGYKAISQSPDYDAATGTWKGYTRFNYDAETQTWKADILSKLYYKDGTTYKLVDDPDFIDALTLTVEEAKAMGVDSNTDKDPSDFLIFDRMSPPGTPGSN
ncbi:MAG: S-layer homology domain-containing protein [Clostridiales bacterium]|nr:S-layer homology domain-containing protein [Clostridiales bacterium]